MNKARPKNRESVVFFLFLAVQIFYTVPPTGQSLPLPLLRIRIESAQCQPTLPSHCWLQPRLPLSWLAACPSQSSHSSAPWVPLTPLSNYSSVRSFCPSLASRRPQAQSYSFPRRTSSCLSCCPVSRHSTAPHRRWRPGRHPAPTWRWWWSGWDPGSPACCSGRWVYQNPVRRSQWLQETEKRFRLRHFKWILFFALQGALTALFYSQYEKECTFECEGP